MLKTKQDIWKKCTYLSNPFSTGRMWHKVEFYVEYYFEFTVFFPLIGCCNKARESSVHFCLYVIMKRRVGFIRFSTTFVGSETETTLISIWTRVANSLSNDDNIFIKWDFLKRSFIAIYIITYGKVKTLFMCWSRKHWMVLY